MVDLVNGLKERRPVDSIFRSFQQGNEVRNTPLRNRLLEQSVEQGDLDIELNNRMLDPTVEGAVLSNNLRSQSLKEKEQNMRFKDEALDALQLRHMLTNGAQDFQINDLFTNRIKKIVDRGGDPAHTKFLQEELNAGRLTPEQLVPALDATIASARSANVLSGDDLSNPRYGRAFEAVVNDERVFAQTDSQGNVKVHSDIKPPVSVSQQKLEDDQKKSQSVRESKAIELANTATQFAQTLSDSAVEGAVGVDGVISGNIGRFTGSREGVLKARIERQSRKMVLQAAEALSGTMSDGDVKLLEETMPKGTDDLAIWEDWYQEEFIPMVRSRATAAGIDFDGLGIPLSIGSKETQTETGQSEQLSIDDLVNKYAD